MNALIYYITIPFIYLLSALPFPLLYLLSDLLFLVLYPIVGYRKQVVIANLRSSFPTYSDAQIRSIAIAYYRYFCDLTLETFKTLTISRREMMKRCCPDDNTAKLLQQFAADGQSIMLVLGHWGNWEWAGNSFSLSMKHPLFVIYHPLSNSRFDALMYRMRTRFGTGLIPMQNVFRDMVSNRNRLQATAFIADQTPQPDNAFWIPFLNQDTPFFKGPEVIARKMGLPVVYVSVKREKRGYYTIAAETLAANPLVLAPQELTKLFAARLERDICAQPECWLWSHRRWKHRRPGV